MTLKPWREIAVPHEDVRKGKLQQAEFAAVLSRVHADTATAEYQNPALFFQRTFITEGMRLLLDTAVKRLAGESATGAPMPERAEPIRTLAYHMYTRCECNGWAEDARAYNELVSAWGGIEPAAGEAGMVGLQAALGI